MQPQKIITMNPISTNDWVSKGTGDTLPIWSSRWRPVGGSNALQPHKQNHPVKKEY